jgi:hypothetical protein
MIVSFDRVAKFFEVTEVDLEHNDSGIMPKASHEFACRLVGGKVQCWLHFD